MYRFSDFDISRDLKESYFIHKLTQKWDEIHLHSDVFRYTINNLQEKFVGKYLLQLNPDRISKRRTPEQIYDICQPFDENKFNFTKVSPKEILFKLMRDGDRDTHLLLVNVSPISRYHTLLCPSVEKLLPQILTQDSLLLSLEVMFLARDRNIRIGFNSLCALASVNHLHYHIFLEKNDLPVETIGCVHLHNQIYILNDYVIPGFCFEINEDSKEIISKEVYKLVAYFLKKSLAHNIFMTRGSSVRPGSREEIIRLIVWPRKSSTGVKQLTAFNVAVCEMSGWFPVYNAADYENLKSEDLENELKKWKIDNFEDLCDEIKQIM